MKPLDLSIDEKRLIEVLRQVNEGHCVGELLAKTQLVVSMVDKSRKAGRVTFTLDIKPHAEYSWWAMRAQLFDLPGYMLNYAMGAFLIADVSGKGLGAALLTTMLQGALSAMTLGTDPARVINHVNRNLIACNARVNANGFSRRAGIDCILNKVAECLFKPRRISAQD